MGKNLFDVINKYYKEAVGGMVQKAPSTLNRGEGTELDYYIFKIDLVGSTRFTLTKTHQTYLKLAHTFLSSVDEIAREFGAEDNQVEYVGDSIVAYFRASEVPPFEVIKAAYWCREAALEMKNLDSTLNKYHFLTKSIIHSGKLIMAKIGPRGDSLTTAIGPELHKACKMESKVLPGQGLVSKEFRDTLQLKQRIVLTPNNYKEIKVLKESHPAPPLPRPTLADYLASKPAGIGAIPPSQPRTLADFENYLRPSKGIGAIPGSLASFDKPIEAPIPRLIYETKKEFVDYSIKMGHNT